MVGTGWLRVRVSETAGKAFHPIESYRGIQALRFLAAFMVVVTHATFFVSSRVSSNIEVWNTGAQGVEIFFVVSGFVMIIAARPLVGRKGASRYLFLSRFIRLVPLYWSLNFLKIAQMLAVPSLAFDNPTISNVVL